ncbi:unnamed protein product [Meganyctiphanes norvegica]|uniref:Uncharacterized protein n=1 Tax=Meganyctiphanes norvegica TaxID=48144 RepID=A0AAV2S5N7_MEGNR
MELKIEENDHMGVREELEEFLPLVRFLTMDLEEFTKHVASTNVFTPEEIQVIQTNISKSNNHQMPPILSTSKVKRKKYLDDSDLKSCTLKDGPDMTKQILYNSGEERILISEFKLKRNIYLSKMEYYANFCHSNAPKRVVTVCDDNDEELVTVPFIGKSAKFNEPLEMKSEKNYTFKLKEGILYNLIQTSWDIVSTDDIASGKKHFWKYPVTLYFWDK